MFFTSDVKSIDFVYKCKFFKFFKLRSKSKEKFYILAVPNYMNVKRRPLNNP